MSTLPRTGSRLKRVISAAFSEIPFGAGVILEFSARLGFMGGTQKLTAYTGRQLFLRGPETSVLGNLA